MNNSNCVKSVRGSRLAGACSVLLAALLAGCSTLPTPFSADEQKQIAANDRKAATADVEPLADRLTLADAIARGIKYNLEHRSRMMEEALAMGQLDLGRYDMLPKLVASAGYQWRDKELITNSRDSVTGLPSLANPYISSDRSHTLTDLALSWNVLDFGVSYFNSKQNADRVLIASERRRKAMHNLIQEVRTAYWRAASAEKIDKDLRETIRLAESALQDSRKIEQERIRDPLEALRYQRTVLENLRILESIQQELAAAKIELAALINLPPGTQFQLAEPNDKELKPAALPMPIERMEDLAIARNADLREQFYNVRIAVAETKKSMLRMFPGLSFNYALRNDTNSYLIHNSWQDAGAQISWNLFTLLSAPANIRYSESAEKLAEHRRMTTQMAVLAQVHLARQQYENAYRLLERADSIWTVDKRIFEHSKSRESAETKGRLDLIFSNTSAIVSMLRRYQALSQVYAASSRIQATLGLEPEIGSINDMPLSDLRRNVENAMDQWSRGEALKAQEPAAQGDAPADDKAAAIDADRPAQATTLPLAAPVQARDVAWTDVSSGAGIGQKHIGTIAWSIADLQDRHMAQLKRGSLAATSSVQTAQ
ncbi:TolC family protein [Zoogloea sp.]|uniref:TolC family protein n=1 Tax=Zoogloea sp. TaxID=49181 RepID=UPI002616174B|nr:TolC family protein [Zoogloea sp.]